MTSLVLPPLLLLLLLAAPTFAATLRVPSEYSTINAAIDAAAFGDTVLVAPGTYHGEIRPYDFGQGPLTTAAVAHLRDGLTLRSESGADETTLDLAGLSAPTRTVIAAALLPSSANVVEGFSIKNDQGTSHGIFAAQVGRLTVRDCVISGITTGGRGGGVRSLYMDLELENCRLVDCAASEGGGIWSLQSGLVMRDCHVENCGGIAVEVDGDGFPRDVEVIDSVFLENVAETAPGLAIFGMNEARVEGCWFEGNIATSNNGGAISVIGTTAEIRRNVFLNNHAGGVGRGAALVASDLFGSVTENTFFGNSQEQVTFGGGTIQCSFVILSLERNIIAASAGSAVRVSFGGQVNSSCNVYWDNPQGHTDGFDMGATDRVVDPLLCDPEDGDLNLMPGSPCLPEFSAGCGLIGVFGEGCGTVAVEESSWGGIKARYFEGDRPGGRHE